MVEKDLLIGMLGYESNNSFTPLIAQALNEDFKQNVITYSVTRVRDLIGPLLGDDYLKYKKLVPLSAALKGGCPLEDLDVLIVDQSYMYLYNDLRIPVMYHHTELQQMPTMGTNNGEGCPTHALYKNPEMSDFYHSAMPYWWKTVRYHYNMFPCAHPLHYNPDYKKDIPCVFVGAPSDMFDRIRDWLWKDMQRDHWEITNYIQSRNLCLCLDDLGEVSATVTELNQSYARAQHMVLTAFNGVYIGRKVFECLASKCIPIIWVENDNAKLCLESLGFKHKVNCYFYHKKEELDYLTKLKYDPSIAENGYNLLLENHTFNHRALQLMNIIERTLPRLTIKKPVFSGTTDLFKYRFNVKKKKLEHINEAPKTAFIDENPITKIKKVRVNL